MTLATCSAARTLFCRCQKLQPAKDPTLLFFREAGGRRWCGVAVHASMERQRSFSLKPTRLALFSFTLASSLLIFLSLYSHGGPPRALEAHIQFTSVVLTPETRSFAESGKGGARKRDGAERLDFATQVSGSSGSGGTDESSRGAHLLLGTGDTDEGAEGSGGEWEEGVLEDIIQSKGIAEPSNAAGAKEGDGDDKDAGSLESDDDAAAEGADSDDSEEDYWEEVVPADAQLGGSANSTNATGEDAAHLSSPAAADGRAVEPGGAVSLDAAASEGNASRSGRPSEVKEENRVTSSGMVAEAVPAAATCDDVSNGRWVFDQNYPLYTNQTCPFIDEGFSCQWNGRPDIDYMKWRWQPYGCDIPRFDAVKMLEAIRGKRLVFVGDSMNRNQWESLLCMLMQGVRDPKRVVEARGRRITKQKGNYNFKFLDYQCSVEYYVTHFLVRESKARVGRKRLQTLRIDAIDRSSSKWKGADVLVFNTAHWWNHHKTKAGKNYFQEGDQVHPQLDVSTAFRKALLTWASWVNQNVSPRKTQVFFRTSSPSHFSGGEWNSGGHCRESTRPLNESTARRAAPAMNVIAEQVINGLKTPVTLLKVTHLSGLRIDGHPSVYGVDYRSGQRRSIQDCSHWCLPGVPDTWNELLYFHLLYQQKPVSSN